MTYDKAELVALDKKYVWHHLTQHKNFEPAIYVKGEGMRITDIDGKTYLDAVSGGVWESRFSAVATLYTSPGSSPALQVRPDAPSHNAWRLMSCPKDRSRLWESCRMARATDTPENTCQGSTSPGTSTAPTASPVRASRRRATTSAGSR